MNTAERKTTRRGFLDAIITFCSVISGLAMAIPGLLYLWPAARGGASESTEVPGAGNFQPGDATTLQVGGMAVIVVRQRSGFKAFSASCTHLGCLVTWERGDDEFKCPCHAAVFDKEGKVVSGPPPEPLAEYAVKEVGEKVFVLART